MENLLKKVTPVCQMFLRVCIIVYVGYPRILRVYFNIPYCLEFFTSKKHLYLIQIQRFVAWKKMAAG